MHQFMHTSIHLPTHPFPPSIHIPIHSFIHWSTYPSYSWICRSIYRHPFFCPIYHASTFPSVHLSIHLYLCAYMHACLHSTNLTSFLLPHLFIFLPSLLCSCYSSFLPFFFLSLPCIDLSAHLSILPSLHPSPLPLLCAPCTNPSIKPPIPPSGIFLHPTL